MKHPNFTNKKLNNVDNPLVIYLTKIERVRLTLRICFFFHKATLKVVFPRECLDEDEYHIKNLDESFQGCRFVVNT